MFPKNSRVASEHQFKPLFFNFFNVNSYVLFLKNKYQFNNLNLLLKTKEKNYLFDFLLILLN